MTPLPAPADFLSLPFWTLDIACYPHDERQPIPDKLSPKGLFRGLRLHGCFGRHRHLGAEEIRAAMEAD